MKALKQDIVSHLLAENENFPNNPKLPLLVIKQALGNGEVSAEAFEQLFNKNSWPAAWRNGLYGFHHYHSSAHEALGLYKGWVDACFGGPGGPVIRAETGDVIIIPAGVSHCNIDQSPDFNVVGAYPEGQNWDMKYGKIEERPAVDLAINGVPLPASDPIFGVNGPLFTFWR